MAVSSSARTAVTMMNRCRPQLSKEAKSSRFPRRLCDRNPPNLPREFARSFHAFEEASDRLGSGKLYAVLRVSKSSPGTDLFRPRFGAFSLVFSKGGEIHLLFTTILRKRLKCRNMWCRSCRRGLEDGGRVKVSAQGRLIVALKGASDGLCPHRG